MRHMNFCTLSSPVDSIVVDVFFSSVTLKAIIINIVMLSRLFEMMNQCDYNANTVGSC